MGRPYDFPQLRSFNKPSEIKHAKKELASIKGQIKASGHLRFQDEPYWKKICSVNLMPSTVLSSQWTPKLYVCVSGRDYFKAIRHLILLSEFVPLEWKFCGKAASLSRPDKIVFYFDNISQLKKVLPQIRKALKGVRFHGISHAGLTSKMGLEDRGKGIYVGADPQFFEKVSWRYYRCIVDASLALNLSHFQEIAKKRGVSVQELFNLSPHHEGPSKFSNSKAQIEFIKKYWKFFSDLG